MEIIRAFELKNNGVFTARLLVRNNSGDVVSSKDIAAGKSATIDLNQHLNTFKDGDTIMMGVKVVGGRSKTSTRKFIYRAGALDKAKFEISGITMTNKLTFVGTKNAYEYHFLDDQDNTHNINGINYLLCPKDSVAVVLEPSEEYKGAVKIPSTITYQKKKYVVTEIGNQAFGYCHELTSLTLPASIFINVGFPCSISIKAVPSHIRISFDRSQSNIQCLSSKESHIRRNCHRCKVSLRRVELITITLCN